MGLNGAGWASFIARIFIASSLIFYILYQKKFKKYVQEFWREKFNKETFRNLLSLGIPTGFQITFEVGAFVIAAIMAGWLGTNALAAHQIAINMAALAYMVSLGFASAATIRVGNQFGLKDFENLKNAGTSIYAVVGIFMLVTATTFILGRHFFPTLYINNGEVIAIASQLLVIAAMFQLSDGYQVVGLGLLRGIQDVKFPTWLTFVAYWIIGLPVGYYLAFHANLGINGIWYGLLLGLTIVALILLIRFYKKAKDLSIERINQT